MSEKDAKKRLEKIKKWIMAIDNSNIPKFNQLPKTIRRW